MTQNRQLQPIKKFLSILTGHLFKEYRQGQQVPTQAKEPMWNHLFNGTDLVHAAINILSEIFYEISTEQKKLEQETTYCCFKPHS